MVENKERACDTGFGKIKVIQKQGLGYGVDAVLLAGFSAGETGAKPIPEGAEVADLGTGSGIVAMIIAHKIPHTKICGMELRSDACDRARKSIEISELSDRVFVENIDIADFAYNMNKIGCTAEQTAEQIPERTAERIATQNLAKHLARYDAVVSNPPYFKKNSAIPSESSDKYIARHETSAELADFLLAAARMLKDGGDLYMVHRPDRMVDILSEMRAAGLEPKELQLVTPRQGEAANIMLVHGIKGGGAELKLLPEIPVHDEKQNYTNIINRIYERRI
jgi:tRNA1Val (adenine37-N6)-methyltransferase